MEEGGGKGRQGKGREEKNVVRCYRLTQGPWQRVRALRLGPLALFAFRVVVEGREYGKGEENFCVVALNVRLRHRLVCGGGVVS